MVKKKLHNSAQQEKNQIEFLSLNHAEQNDSTLYRVKPNSCLLFCPGFSLLGKRIALFCNYPSEGNYFEREKYSLLQWHSSRNENDTLSPNLGSSENVFTTISDTDMYCMIVPYLPGSYHYYFTYETEPGQPQGSGYFSKDPKLSVGEERHVTIITPDSVRCQTVLVKCLGSFNTWESKLMVAKESGYNMIHFTPIQELGASRSSYSISNQLLLNNTTNNADATVQFEDVEKLLGKISKQWGMASICDIVLNHTANESKWLIEHPDCAYNCINSPHLRPAALLDFMLAKLSNDVATGKWKLQGVPENITNDSELQELRKILNEHYLLKLKIWEFYQIDVENLTKQFSDLLNNSTCKLNNKYQTSKDIFLLQDDEHKRMASIVDLQKAVDIFSTNRQKYSHEELYMKDSTEQFQKRLSELNEGIINEISINMNHAIDNILAGVRYERIQEDGPKYSIINENQPLFTRYFTDMNTKEMSLADAEKLIFSENGCFIMAHNGWVMNSDPLNDFAKYQGTIGNVYLRRELIAWGDSVKLRYGDRSEDCPYLWGHMRQYVEQTAKIFHGVRLDNCHSTPLHVAEYMLDCARRIKPQLYVVAELFTNSDSKDNIFVNRLGITTLIREAQSAWDSHELGRLIYRYGGEPVGAFQRQNFAKNHYGKQLLTPVIANALLMDLTHDNPSPIEKRSIYDLLPTSALVSMACCGTGSNRGYDELVPHHIHVVNEEREYASWGSDLDKDHGILLAKKCVNELHDLMSKEGFLEVYVDQMSENIVAVTRHNPQTHESIILVAYSCFKNPSQDWPTASPAIRPICFEGHLEEILFEAGLEIKSSSECEYKFVKNDKIINGRTDYSVDVQQHIKLIDSLMLNHSTKENRSLTELHFSNFRPGSVLAIRVSLHDSATESISKLNNVISSLNDGTDDTLNRILSNLDLNHINQILYKCDQEERDSGSNIGVYDIPNFGPMVYCGLQGFISLLDDIKRNNDLGHPMCANLREGDWMIDYVWQRLQYKDGLSELSDWLKAKLEPLKKIPRYLIPRYFETVVNVLYNTIRNHSINLMSNFIKNGSTFTKCLGMASVQFMSVCQSARLPPFSPTLDIDHTECSTMSAGLPHFATDYMRCWGRDTFISLRGILLLTGRFDEARNLILGFGSCLRHGLIPNLLSGGYNARFNCRDAVWWWLECIKSYVSMVPNGESIFTDSVSRIYPSDDSDAKGPGEVDQPLHDVIQEALQKHFQGLKFRERNAGRKIDEHMTDSGFNNEIGVDPETGFVFGGNEWNCGTWMDKMGSSSKACTKGTPATPRDGSAVEIVGLSYSAIKWLSTCYDTSVYPYEGVEKYDSNGVITKWTFKQWAERIETNFERHFYIAKHDEYVNQLDIYKDTVGATKPWADYQMRCNFPIAMAVAPDLFEKEHAWKALKKVKKHLLGPLGMKTLDPSDWAYRGNYDNSNDSEDASIAHGFNYHQGPEWLWPVGYYLRAYLQFAIQMNGVDQALSEIRSILSQHLNEIQSNDWRGLPELTNENGTFCKDSCRTQAWSIATLLETIYDIEYVRNTSVQC